MSPEVSRLGELSRALVTLEGFFARVHPGVDQQFARGSKGGVAEVAIVGLLARVDRFVLFQLILMKIFGRTSWALKALVPGMDNHVSF